MKNILKVFACGTVAMLVAFALSQTAQAQNNLYGGTASINSWYGATPSFETGPAPTTGSGGTTPDNDSWGGAHGVNGYGSLSEVFYLTSPSQLGYVELGMAGSAASFNVELYDMGPLSSFPGYPAGPGAAPAITQVNMYPYQNVLTTGDYFNFYGAAGNVIQVLDFTGADRVLLQANELYQLSLDPMASANNTWWLRGGTTVAGYTGAEGMNSDGGISGTALGDYTAEQAFEGKSSVRVFDFAEVDIPEPSTIALGVIGASFLLRRRSK